MQVKDSLNPYRHSHKVIHISKEVHEPRHVVGPVKDDGKSHIACHSFVDDAYIDGAQLENLRVCIHANVVPHPTAMMRDKINRSLI